MTRKTTQLTPNTKNALKDIQTSLKLKNESQAVAYLIAAYNINYPKMTMPQHRNCMEYVEDVDGQAEFS